MEFLQKKKSIFRKLFGEWVVQSNFRVERGDEVEVTKKDGNITKTTADYCFYIDGYTLSKEAETDYSEIEYGGGWDFWKH